MDGALVPTPGASDLFESWDFTQALVTQEGWATSIVGGTITPGASGTANLDHPGIVDLALPITGAGGNRVTYRRSITAMALGRPGWFDAVFRVGSVPAVGNDFDVNIGLRDQNSISATNGLFVRWGTAAGTFRLVGEIASAETVADTGIAVTVGWHRAICRWFGDGRATLSIDGSVPTLLAAGAPTAVTSLCGPNIVAAEGVAILAATTPISIDLFRLYQTGLAR